MTTIGFPYTLPTTGNVSLLDFIAPNAQYQRPLSNATAFRGRLRTALKEHKHSDRHDLLNIQKALEDYIPLLFGYVAGIENSELILTTDVETVWRCTLTNAALSSKQPRVKQKSIYYEAIFTLLTLGYVLMDRANESSQAVQRRIQIAIGDVSTYTGGYGDGSSMTGSGLNSSGSGSGSGSGNGHHTSSGSNDGSSNSGSKLFKKISKSSSKNGSNTIGEFTDYLTEEDLAGIDQQLTSAADLYCKAAGVFEYVTQQMIPRWNQRLASVTAALSSSSSSNSSASTPTGVGKAVTESARPVDVQTNLISAHVKLALAEAHACTVRKASIKAARASSASAASGFSGSTATTGSKTSYVLLAKLTIGVKEEYERAYGLLKSVKDLNDISMDFRNHVKDAKLYYEASAQSLLGLDAYEAQQYGKAIGFMSAARTSFGALSKSSKSPTISHAAAFEFRLTTEKVQSYQKINDSVTFLKVPVPAELLPLMPSGRDLLNVKAYQAPKPEFGIAATAPEGGADDGVAKLTYAMQGAYF
ncbi:hypothetical protein BGZ83_002124 [Gryganskiella cystojenkinii]|nr:hypothetical protein BGZ83_002124 [Gryganskiella cystojenkinii]